MNKIKINVKSIRENIKRIPRKIQFVMKSNTYGSDNKLISYIPYDERIVWYCRHGKVAEIHTVGRAGRTVGTFCVGFYFRFYDVIEDKRLETEGKEISV